MKITYGTLKRANKSLKRTYNREKRALDKLQKIINENKDLSIGIDNIRAARDQVLTIA